MRLRGLFADALVLLGIGLVAYGAWHVPGGWGDVLGPVVLGLGLLLVVRWGLDV